MFYHTSMHWNVHAVKHKLISTIFHSVDLCSLFLKFLFHVMQLSKCFVSFRFIPFHQLLRYSFATSLKNLVYFLICCYLAQNALWEKNRTKIKKSYFVVSSIQHYYPSFYGMQMPNAFNAQACHSTTFFLFILYLPVRIKFRFIIFENKSISNLVHFSASIETKLNKKKVRQLRKRSPHLHTKTRKFKLWTNFMRCY